MYCVLETEIKLNGDKVSYIEPFSCGVFDTFECARIRKQFCVECTIEQGQFDKIVSQSDSCTILTNGGSSYMHYRIMKL